MINKLQELKNKKVFLPEDNGREINIYEIENVSIYGESTYYPNVLIRSNNDNKIYNPINEVIMSLSKLDIKVNVSNKEIEYELYDHDVFFFVYNIDNYYHFVYDTLPYLITYKHLKLKNSSLKLLMNYSNPQSNKFYKFVLEFLELLDISENDIVIINNYTLYKRMYISDSYTHNGLSNHPPRKEIYDFYQNILEENILEENLPKKIYISRRAWIHNDYTNIGTNYTNRRKMINEDQLVEYLTKNGFVEIFTENLNTKDKILLFKNCDIIVGAIGGGLCNALFSNENTKIIPIISPGFLDINLRFIYSFSKINPIYFDQTYHESKEHFKKYMRVKYNNIIGEIIDIYDNTIKIQYIDEVLAGWNSEIIYKNVIAKKDDVIILDNGLNSPWYLDLEEFKKIKIS